MGENINNMIYWRKIKPYFGIILTTAFLSVMLYAVDLEASVNALSSANPLILILALVSANVPLLIYSQVWRTVLSATGLDLSYFTTLRLILANTFVNNITPFGNIGGEAAATYILSNISDKSYGESFTAVFMASIINFSPLFTFLIIGAVYTEYYQMLLLPLTGLTFCLLINYSVFSFKVPGFLEKFRDDFIKSLNTIKSSGISLWPLIIITHFAIFFDILSIILIGASLNLDFYSFAIFLVVPLARVANYVPTPGGTGPYELALSGLLVFFFPVSISESVLVAVIYRTLTYYIGILFGYFTINSFNIGKKYLTS